ncbi:MAG: hypothetical protein ACMG6H_16500 [Acidobacteriota bacterium]
MLNRPRRTALAQAIAGALRLVWRALAASAERFGATHKLDRRWYDAAVSMKRRAESWGDQPGCRA